MKKLEEYTAEEIEKFNHIHDVLKRYNKLLSEDIDPVRLPDFTEDEIMEYSAYREKLLAFLCNPG